MEKYFGDFGDRDDVMRQFSEGGMYGYEENKIDEASFPTDEEILFAWYVYEDYSGSAFVLFEQDGQLYSVQGGHCSCYGLEGQWDPEATTWDYVKGQLDYLSCGNTELETLIKERVG